jgi:hypothetical protein
VVLFGGITALRHLHHVEPEFRSEMRRAVLCVLDGVAVLRPQLRVFNRDTQVDSRMAGNV